MRVRLVNMPDEKTAQQFAQRRYGEGYKVARVQRDAFGQWFVVLHGTRSKKRAAERTIDL